MKKIILFALGLFMTLGAQAAKEVYTVFNNGTLTYYYDDQKDSRPGIKALYNPDEAMKKPRLKDYCKEIIAGAIDVSMKEAPLTSLKGMFCGGWEKYDGGQKYYLLSNMTFISGLENLNTDIVTDMSSMFYGCQSMQSLDLNSFNTAEVTNMSYMFTHCANLKEIKGLEKFNTAKVLNMKSMFYGCQSLQSLDLRPFNWDKVTDVSIMFCSCSHLTTIYCDVDLSAKTGLFSENMFMKSDKLVGGQGTKFDSNNLDATYACPDGKDGKKGYFTGTMPVYSVYSANTLTFYCDYKKDSRSGMKDLYDPATVTTVKRFEGYNEMVTSAVIDPSMAKAQLTSLSKMFYSEVGSYFGNLPNLTTITGLENLNTENVTDMSSMFGGCWALTAPLNFSNFNTANVTDMSSMFAGCSVLVELDLTSFDVTKVTNMTSMFQGCKNLTTIYCEKDWTTGVVTKSTNMFENCKKLHGDNGTKWVTGNPQDITYARPDGGSESTTPGYFSKKTATGLESIQNSAISSQKVLRDGQIFILHGDKIYTITGQEVR